MKIRPIAREDFAQWKPLFEGYCEFYHEATTEGKNQTAWNALHNPDHVLTGIVAEDSEGNIQGIAHYHAWLIPLYGCDICYLSDLFVNPEARGNKAGKRLYEYLLQECKQKGWPALVLLTQDENTTARSLYDQYGERSDFGFYITPVEL